MVLGMEVIGFHGDLCCWSGCFVCEFLKNYAGMEKEYGNKPLLQRARKMLVF